MLRNSQQNQEPSHQRRRVNADANPNPKQDGCQSHVWRTVSSLPDHRHDNKPTAVEILLTDRTLTDLRAGPDAWRGLSMCDGLTGSRTQQDLDLPPLSC